MKKQFFKRILIGMLTVTLVAPEVYADVTASVRGSEVQSGTPFTLTISSNTRSAQPDLSPLQADFQVLGMGQQTSTQIINGHQTTQYGWNIALQAKSKGQVEIPALRLGNEYTRVIPLNVVDRRSETSKQPASSSGSTQIPELSVSVPDGPFYVGQEVPVTLQIVGVGDLIDGALSPLEVKGAQVIAPQENAEEDKVSERLVDGERVKVIERTFRVKPQEAGQLTIAPVTLDGHLRRPPTSRQNSRDPFAGFDSMFSDDFFNRDPFDMLKRDPFGSGLGSSLFDRVFDRGERITIRSDAHVLDVDSKPSEVEGWFLPAKHVEISANWVDSNPNFQAGETISRQVRVSARGASIEQIPDLNFTGNEDLKIYVDRVDDDELQVAGDSIATKVYTLSIVPMRSGVISVPGASMRWWDTVNATENLARLASEEINVRPGAIAETPVVPVSTDKGVVNELGNTSSESANRDLGLTWVFILILAVLVLVALVVWYGVSSARKRKPGSPESTTTGLEKALQKACRQGDASATYECLSALVDLTQPMPRQLRDELDRLESQLFNDGHGLDRPWDGMRLYRAYRAKDKKPASSAATRIPSLYAKPSESPARS